MLWKYWDYILRVWGFLSSLTRLPSRQPWFYCGYEDIPLWDFCYQLFSCSLWVCALSLSSVTPPQLLSRSTSQPLTLYKSLLLVCTSHASSSVLMLGPAWDGLGITKGNKGPGHIWDYGMRRRSGTTSTTVILIHHVHHNRNRFQFIALPEEASSNRVHSWPIVYYMYPPYLPRMISYLESGSISGKKDIRGVHQVNNLI